MKKVICFIITAFLLSGCQDGMPPRCDSKETKALLDNVIQQYIDKNSYLKQSISRFNVTGHEELESYQKAKEYACEARVVFHYKNGEMESDLMKYSVFSDNTRKGMFYVQITE